MTKTKDPVEQSVKNCSVKELGDGSAIAAVRIDPDVLRRLKLRAEPWPLDEFLWENVFRKALSGMAFTGGI